MIRLRKRRLPQGWYPSSAQEAEGLFQQWRIRYPLLEQRFHSGVVPHAGWQFSGPLAFAVFQQLAVDEGTVVIVGGHLRPGDPVVIAPEDSYETPFGPVSADVSLRSAIQSELAVEDDRATDNTVEIHLPIVRYLFPRVRCLSVRSPPSSESTTLGTFLAEYSRRSQANIAVVGSTDLTHYGPDYRFTPHGTGSEALKWVTDVNDRLVISALSELDHQAILEAGNAHRAACSAGAANTAAAFAKSQGTAGAEIIDHYTSYDIYPRESFVGYVGLGYRQA